ncbi:hypothetical protein F4678DRAFT_453604 [Xylaria arbuscula]|nr:hypothetical protein F4678DRAFT_453604 [Xylaria arbuscula]
MRAISMTNFTQKDQLLRHCIEATSTIQSERAEILVAKDHHDDHVTITKTSLAGCGPALVDLLSRQATIVRNLYDDHSETAISSVVIKSEQKSSTLQKYDLALKRLEDIASIAYSKFYAYLFKDLPVCWRQLYTDARILKFCLLFLRSPYSAEDDSGGGSSDDVHGCLDELVKTLDLALVLAGAAGERRGRRWIDKALELLHLIWLAENKGQGHDGDSAVNYDRPAKRTKLTENHETLSIHNGHTKGAMFSTDEPFTPQVTHPVRKTEALSIDEFQTYMDRPRDPNLGPEPLILRNALIEWPALSTHPWNRPSYLLSQTFDGRRLVPVEIGRSYVDEGWGQKLITFGEFLHKYIDPTSLPATTDQRTTDPNSSSKDTNPENRKETPSPKPTAYLAQHQLFTQLPTLRNDILIPDYCYTTPPHHPTDPRIDQPELDAPLLNAWFGPPGTISPLHNDPYHNILTQIVGRKYVRLYAPQETARLAARGRENGVEMGNTSMLDVGVLEGWDDPAPAPSDDDQGVYEESSDTKDAATSKGDIEAFKTVPFVDCILEPGDALYIPIGWWHYVRGLSVSFSVSFWWN